MCHDPAVRALCRHYFIVSGWGFFVGMLAATPVSAWAVRPGTLLREVIWTLASFSTYFWAAGLFTIWRMNFD